MEIRLKNLGSARPVFQGHSKVIQINWHRHSDRSIVTHVPLANMGLSRTGTVSKILWDIGRKFRIFPPLNVSTEGVPLGIVSQRLGSKNLERWPGYQVDEITLHFTCFVTNWPLWKHVSNSIVSLFNWNHGFTSVVQSFWIEMVPFQLAW